jgi:hypothetical protein
MFLRTPTKVVAGGFLCVRVVPYGDRFTMFINNSFKSKEEIAWRLRQQ